MVLVKALPGFEEFEGYGITSCGRVWSFKRNKFLKPILDKRGYFCVDLRTPGKRKTISIHRLVALAYIPNPNNYDTVDHIDEDKTHNYVNNLQWMANIDNFKKSRCSSVMCIETGEIFESQRDAAEKLGLFQANISRVCNGKRNQTGGYHFKFV